MKQRKVLFGLAVACLTSLSTLVPQKTQAVEWVWGTLKNAQGIAVCDGAADNCTHPGKEVVEVAP